MQNVHSILIPSALRDRSLCALDLEVLTPRVNLVETNQVSVSVRQNRKIREMQILALQEKPFDPDVPLEIRVRKNEEHTLLRLPEPLSQNFIRFLNEAPCRDQHDCASFVHDLLGLPYTFGSGFLDRDWDYYDLEPGGEVPPGLPLVQCTEGWLSHTSISLGSQLFISKSGNGGPILISTLEVMKEIWGGSRCSVYTTFRGVSVNPRHHGL